MNNIYVVVLIGIGSGILLASFLPKNSNFLDIRSIFSQHLKIFLGSPLQFVSVFMVPGLFAVGIVLVRCVTRGILNNLNIVLSILIAMFFSILGIICSLNGTEKKGSYEQLLKETFTATTFEIIICLLLLLVSFATLFIGNFDDGWLLKIISGIIYYLTIVVILNILAVIKRIKVLFDNR